jgi:hypothetical protein
LPDVISEKNKPVEFSIDMITVQRKYSPRSFEPTMDHSRI